MNRGGVGINQSPDVDVLYHARVLSTSWDLANTILRVSARGNVAYRVTRKCIAKPTSVLLYASVLNFERPNSISRVNNEQHSPGPRVVVPSQYSLFHAAWHLVMSHVQLGTVQQTFELQPVCVSVRYHVTHLPWK